MLQALVCPCLACDLYRYRTLDLLVSLCRGAVVAWLDLAGLLLPAISTPSTHETQSLVALWPNGPTGCHLPDQARLPSTRIKECEGEVEHGASPLWLATPTALSQPQPPRPRPHRQR